MTYRIPAKRRQGKISPQRLTVRMVPSRNEVEGFTGGAAVDPRFAAPGLNDQPTYALQPHPEMAAMGNYDNPMLIPGQNASNFGPSHGESFGSPSTAGTYSHVRAPVPTHMNGAPGWTATTPSQSVRNAVTPSGELEIYGHHKETRAMATILRSAQLTNTTGGAPVVYGQLIFPLQVDRTHDQVVGPMLQANGMASRAPMNFHEPDWEEVQRELESQDLSKSLNHTGQINTARSDDISANIWGLDLPGANTTMRFGDTSDSNGNTTMTSNTLSSNDTIHREAFCHGRTAEDESAEPTVMRRDDLETIRGLRHKNNTPEEACRTLQAENQRLRGDIRDQNELQQEIATLRAELGRLNGGSDQVVDSKRPRLGP